MIKGVGIDIVDFKRIDLKISKKILSLKETKIYESLINDNLKKEYLAERFAFKEALFKADNSYYEYNTISILNDSKGKPYLDGIKSQISVAHDGGMVVAVVILEA